MYRKGWIYRITVLIGCLTMITSGCSLLSSGGITEAMVQGEQEINTFYGEAEIRQYYNEELLCTVSYKEWKGTENKYRVECKTAITDGYKENVDNGLIKGNIDAEEEIDVTDGNQLIAYVPSTETYYIRTATLADEVNPVAVQGINQILLYGSLREYALELINEVSESHNVTVEDNIRYENYTTQHVVAVPKEGKQGDATIEVWIDQDSWMVVKLKSTVGKLVVEREYKKFTFNPRIDQEKFILTIPEGAKVIKLDENLDIVNQEVSLKDRKSVV